MDEMPLEVHTDKPVNPQEVPSNTSVTTEKPENPLGVSRIGVTKRIYREQAEKKARKVAKKMRKMNRRRNKA